MASNLPDNAEHPADTDLGPDNAYVLWHSLQQHARFHEYYRQIRACLLCDNNDWYSYTCLRTNSTAANFVEDLHLSTMYLIPPTDIFNVLLRLRVAPNWPAVRVLAVTQMTTYQHLSLSTASTTSSATWSSAAAHLSSGSATTYSNPTSTYAIFDAVEESACEEQLSHRQAQPEAIRRRLIQTTGSGKASRMAPDGYRFACPYRKCRGKYAFRRVGDFDRHVRDTHCEAGELNAYNYLKRDLHIITPSAPVKSETTDNSATLAPESSGGAYTSVDAFNDFPPSRPEVHLPMEQLTDIRLPMIPKGHYRNTGVQVLHSDDDARTAACGTQRSQSGSFLHLDDHDDDYMHD